MMAYMMMTIMTKVIDDDSSYDDVNVGEGNDDDDGNDIKDDDDYDLNDIGHFGKYHNTLCLSPQNLHKHCFQFLLGLAMVPRENKNNAYAKFWGTNKEYFPKWPILQ